MFLSGGTSLIGVHVLGLVVKEYKSGRFTAAGRFPRLGSNPCLTRHVVVTSPLVRHKEAVTQLYVTQSGNQLPGLRYDILVMRKYM